jgi:transposase
VQYRTVQAWVAWYRQGGVAEGLGHWHGGHGGQERRLTADQEADLKSKAAAGDIRTIHEGVAWVKQIYGVEYSYWACAGSLTA